MTNDECTMICGELDRIKALVTELVESESFLLLTGKVGNVNVAPGIGGYLHYFRLSGEETHVIFYPGNDASEIGEVLSSCTTLTVKAKPVPNEFGTETFWIYSTADILAVDGQAFKRD